MLRNLLNRKTVIMLATLFDLGLVIFLVYLCTFCTPNSKLIVLPLIGVFVIFEVRALILLLKNLKN